MAVWERKGEDKAILEKILLEETNGVLKKRSGRLVLKKERFWVTHRGVRDFCRRELSCASDLPLRLTYG
jgi:hypothetical protein